MNTDKEKAEIKKMIQSLYRFANILPVWDGEVNDDVAAVFGTMIAETRTCSKAFGWVPKPPGGRASVTWLAQQLGRGVFRIAAFYHSAVRASLFTNGNQHWMWRRPASQPESYRHGREDSSFRANASDRRAVAPMCRSRPYS